MPNLDNASNREAVAALLGQRRPLLSFVTSFVVIGVLWLNHHNLFHILKRVDRGVIVLNLALLLVVSFIPYPTSLIGQYGTLRPIVVLYGAVLGLRSCPRPWCMRAAA